MSHKSGHIIIERVPQDTTGDEAVLISLRAVITFSPATPVEDRIRVIARVERLLDRVDHDDDVAG